MLAAAGADDIALFPCPDLQLARLQIDDAVRLAGALRASVSG
jgi:hypothetical protein